MKKLLSRRVLLIVSLLSAMFFFYSLYRISIVPLKYFIPAIVVIVFILLVLYLAENEKKQKKPIKVILLKLLNILLSFAMIFGSVLVMQGSNFISAIANANNQTIEMNIAVLKTSSYQKLSDLEGKAFGANTKSDAININKTETLIEDKIGDINITQYTSHNEVVQGLKRGEVEAIVLKAVDLKSLDSIEKDFQQQLRIVQKFDIKIPSAKANSAKVTQEVFHVFISGTDKRGNIDRADALSDVNMVATVNPVTKQVLITSIPRDYYVDIYNNGSSIGKDKLTHSATLGIQSTQDTVNHLLDIDINYYAKFNFTSFMSVVDALGGIDITIPKYKVVGNNRGEFTTKIYKYKMKPGKTHMNSKQALAFVRERKSFLEGDNVRNKNQMIMLKAILKKCCSLGVITKLDGILGSLSESFETNMSENEIKSLINMQIDDMASWDVQSYHLEGDSGKRVKYLATVGDVTRVNPQGLYIMDPIQDSVEQAKEYIKFIKENDKKILKIKE